MGTFKCQAQTTEVSSLSLSLSVSLLSRSLFYLHISTCLIYIIAFFSLLYFICRVASSLFFYFLHHYHFSVLFAELPFLSCQVGRCLFTSYILMRIIFPGILLTLSGIWFPLMSFWGHNFWWPEAWGWPRGRTWLGRCSSRWGPGLHSLSSDPAG